MTFIEILAIWPSPTVNSLTPFSIVCLSICVMFLSFLKSRYKPAGVSVPLWRLKYTCAMFFKYAFYCANKQVYTAHCQASRLSVPVHGVVVHEGAVALQVELAEGQDAQRHEGDGEHQAQQGVGGAAALCNAAHRGRQGGTACSGHVKRRHHQISSVSTQIRMDFLKGLLGLLKRLEM